MKLNTKSLRLPFVNYLEHIAKCKGWGVLPIMAYTGRLRQKGIPFSDFSFMKGWGFYSLKYTKG